MIAGDHALGLGGLFAGFDEPHDGTVAVAYLAGICGLDPVAFGTELIQKGMDLDHTPLPALLSLIANEGAIISRIEQERGSPDLPLSLNRVTLEMELRGPEHGDRVLHVLRDHGYRV